MTGGLRLAALKGASWTGGAQVCGYLMNIAALGTAARYLTVGAFGVEAAALTVVGAAGLVSDLGVGRALVQRPVLREGHPTAALIVSIVGALIAPLLLWWTAGLWGEVFVEARVASVLPVMCLGLACTSLGAVPRALMERGLWFGRLSAVDVAATMGSAGTLITMAVGGHGLWSLVWAYVVRSAVLGLGPWLLCGRIPLRSFSVSEAGELVRFGWKWSGAQLLSFGQRNLDYLVLSRFLGSHALGYYTLAFRLIAFPQIRISQVVTRVTFPAFARIQNDLPRLRGAYTQTTSAIAALAFPTMAGLALLADPGVLLLYGADKVPVVRVVQILAAAGAARSVGGPAGLVYLALGRTGLALLWTAAAGLLTLLALRLGVTGGLTGVAAAVALSGLILLTASQAVVNRLVGSGYRAFLRALSPALVSTAAMTGCVLGFQWLVPVSGWLSIGGTICVGAAVYLLCLRLLATDLWDAVGDLYGTRRERP